MNYEYFDPSEQDGSQNAEINYQLDYSTVANGIDEELVKQILELSTPKPKAAQNPLLGICCKIFGGLFLYQTLSKSSGVDLAVIAQASIGAYTFLISALSTGTLLKKLVSFWHAFFVTVMLLGASKLYQFEHKSTNAQMIQIEVLLLGGCFITASLLATRHAKELTKAGKNS